MLDKNFDYSKTYYKVLNEKENHHGFQYKDGLNILDKKFDNPDEPCSTGGLYFVDIDHLPLMFNYGDHIREIKIPDGSKIAQNGYEWRTDKMILGRTIMKDEYFEKMWNPDKFNWEDSDYLARYSSEYIESWWNPDKFNWNDSWVLAMYCSKYFKIWWNPDLFDRHDLWTLAKHCSEYFETWWNPDQLKWYYFKFLTKYCSNFKYIWEQHLESKI